MGPDTASLAKRTKDGASMKREKMLKNICVKFYRIYLRIDSNSIFHLLPG